MNAVTVPNPLAIKTTAKTKREKAIDILKRFAISVLDARYTDFYLQGYMDFAPSTYDSEWCAFHDEVIEAFRDEGWIVLPQSDQEVPISFSVTGEVKEKASVPCYRFYLSMDKEEPA